MLASNLSREWGAGANRHAADEMEAGRVLEAQRCKGEVEPAVEI